MHLYIPFVILLSIFVLLSKSTKLSSSYHFRRYIRNISPKVYSVKVNKSPIFFTQRYLSLLQEIPNNKKQILIKYTHAMNRFFSENDLQNLANIKTNYIMSVTGLEKNMPFTLANNIILPKKIINKLSNNIDPSILETIVHEKLHIIQRIKQQRFDNFYIKSYPFLYKKIPLEYLPSHLKDIHMTNPDNNFSLWLYKIKNIIYIPILEYSNQKLSNTAYEYYNTKQKYLLDTLLEKRFSQPHPNEIFAYSTSKEFIKNNVPKTKITFLRTLKF
tara:strand:+ start:178 stop:996 length:819 start_codon:yes stop_codon:yes gene_type:complete